MALVLDNLLRWIKITQLVAGQKTEFVTISRILSSVEVKSFSRAMTSVRLKELEISLGLRI